MVLHSKHCTVVEEGTSTMVFFPGRPWRPLCYAGIGSCVNGCTEVHWKAAFHFSTQLQTWSQAGRKHVESQLRTCLKRVFFYTFHLSSTRTNQRTCCGSRPGFRQKKSKAGRKRVTNPHKLVENLAVNLVENQVSSWLQYWSAAFTGSRAAQRSILCERNLSELTADNVLITIWYFFCNWLIFFDYATIF